MKLRGMLSFAVLNHLPVLTLWSEGRQARTLWRCFRIAFELGCFLLTKDDLAGKEKEPVESLVFQAGLAEI